MTLGLAPKQGDLLGTTVGYCEGRVGADSIYAVLNRECFTLFPDEMFADLFTDVGRRSVPPMIVAVVMVLQRIEGCSDREAVDRFAFDARWKYAAGGLLVGRGFDASAPSPRSTARSGRRLRSAVAISPMRLRSSCRTNRPRPASPVEQLGTCAARWHAFDSLMLTTVHPYRCPTRAAI